MRVFRSYLILPTDLNTGQVNPISGMAISRCTFARLTIVPMMVNQFYLKINLMLFARITIISKYQIKLFVV